MTTTYDELTLTPDAKRLILDALEDGRLDPHDELSSTEKQRIFEVCAPEVYEYRFVIDINISGDDREPDLDELRLMFKQHAALIAQEWAANHDNSHLEWSSIEMQEGHGT